MSRACTTASARRSGAAGSPGNWSTSSAPRRVSPSTYTSVSYGSALTEPHGRIHWAGTKTTGEWVGTMDGAVLTGPETAEQVARRLGVEGTRA
ncbi:MULTISPECIES: FAD-dependent oxidoreductase [unclassified Streptomyces]|uniref:FAD-dependent oxidoreductase n=1 Tax=unclassified Streptomyces TaxID=2593676 RepID=UPI003329D1C7